MGKRLISPDKLKEQLISARKSADRVPKLLNKLDLIAVGLAENEKNLENLPFNEILQALDDLREDMKEFELLRTVDDRSQSQERALQAIEDLMNSVVSGLAMLAETIQSIPKPEKAAKPPDYRRELADLSRKVDGITVTADMPAPVVQPAPAYEFTNITRDADGNIATATVNPVTKH